MIQKQKLSFISVKTEEQSIYSFTQESSNLLFTFNINNSCNFFRTNKYKNYVNKNYCRQCVSSFTITNNKSEQHVNIKINNLYYNNFFINDFHLNNSSIYLVNNNNIKKNIDFYTNKISLILSKIIVSNKLHINNNTLNNSNTEINKPYYKLLAYFDSNILTKMSLSEYINRIVSNLYLESNILIYSLIIMDRFLNKFYCILNEMNVYYILSISILISLKMNLDYKLPTLKYLSELFGIEEDIIECLEIIFLKFLRYDAHVNNKDFKLYINKI